MGEPTQEGQSVTTVTRLHAVSPFDQANGSTLGTFESEEISVTNVLELQADGTFAPVCYLTPRGYYPDGSEWSHNVLPAVNGYVHQVRLVFFTADGTKSPAGAPWRVEFRYRAARQWPVRVESCGCSHDPTA